MSAAEPPVPVPKSKLRWFQYSLRSLVVFITLCAILCSWLAVKRWQRSLTLEGKAEAAIDQFLDGHTVEGLGCGYVGPHLGTFNFAPGECGELVTICRDLVKIGKPIGKPWRPTDCFPAPGSDCIGFRLYSKAQDNTELKYAVCLDVRTYVSMSPGSIGFIRLIVYEDDWKYFYAKDMPLYPADVDRIKDAVEQARSRQRHGVGRIP